MNTIKWFDRSFDFSFGIEYYPLLYKRLADAPERMSALLVDIPEDRLSVKPDDKWSLKEHLAHLSVLEPLWRTRIQDIASGKRVLTAADLDNQAISSGNFNSYGIDSLLQRFAEERNLTLQLLDSLDIASVVTASLHPRLQQPMRLVDHLYFEAEHDDHHIDYINHHKHLL